ncbi:MAG: hypothetical protein ACR2PL_12420 [Dehalococcoidia bacterium]
MVDAVDALCILRSVARLPVTSACPAVPLTLPSVGDVNGDLTVDAVDALCILRSVASMPRTTVCPVIPIPSPDGTSVSAGRSLASPVAPMRVLASHAPP